MVEDLRFNREIEDIGQCVQVWGQMVCGSGSCNGHCLGCFTFNRSFYLPTPDVAAHSRIFVEEDKTQSHIGAVFKRAEGDRRRRRETGEQRHERLENRDLVVF